MLKLNLIFLLALTVACGDQKDAAQPIQQEAPKSQANQSFLVNSASKLPTCADSNKGSLGYVQDESTFYVCNESTWAAIEIKGEKGDAGTAGTKGDKGDKGETSEKGTDNHIVSSMNCSAALTQKDGLASDLLYVPALGLRFIYNVVVMSSGDVFSNASISTKIAQTSGSSFYAAKDTASKIAGVLITDDYSADLTGGTWTISLDRSTMLMSALFEDSTLPNSSTRLFSFPLGSCTAKTF